MLISFDDAPDGTLLSKVFRIDGFGRQSQLGFKTPIDGFDDNGNPDPSNVTYAWVPDPDQPECPDHALVMGYTPHE
jgi:hypothetical protein